MELKQIFNPI